MVNKNNFLKKVSPLILTLFYGCSNLQLPKMIKNAKPIPFGGEAFTCNYWEDKNQNQKIERNEIKGLKKIFNENEKITIMKEFINKNKFNYECRILDSNGILRLFFGGKIPDINSCIIKGSYNTSKIKNKWGPGIYTIEWYSQKSLGRKKLEKKDVFMIK